MSFLVAFAPRFFSITFRQVFMKTLHTFSSCYRTGKQLLCHLLIYFELFWSINMQQSFYYASIAKSMNTEDVRFEQR